LPAARNEHADPGTTHSRYHAVRSVNVHAESLSVRTRVRRTRIRTAARSAHSARVHIFLRMRTCMSVRARELLFPSVSEDRRPWPRDHERRLIILVRERYGFVLPLYIRIHGLSLCVRWKMF